MITSNQNQNIKHQSLAGHHYAFCLTRIGWVNQGMIDDTKRDFYANHFFVNGDTANKDKVSAVAFLPYCIEGSNFVTQHEVETDSVQTIMKVHFQGGQVAFPTVIKMDEVTDPFDD